MSARHKVGHFTEDLAKTPGPGTYGVHNPNLTKKRQPLYSMSARNSLPGDSTTKPGPGAHSPEKHNPKRKAPSYSFGTYHSEYTTPILVGAD